VNVRAAIATTALAVAALSSAAAQPCTASRVDVADWAIVRSANVPGFTFRLPRSFTRDAEPAPSDRGPAKARWTDPTRASFAMAHLGATRTALAPLPSSAGRALYTRCEERVGSATAIIVSYGEGPSANAFVVHARIRWPDGEELDVRARSGASARMDQLIAAVKTVRRAGA
jgi:hypothetical protein